MNSDFDVVVSMTSYPHRFRNSEFPKILFGILNQKTRYKFKFVLSLFKDDIPKMPYELKQIVNNNGIEVLPCELDIKSHKKYYYVMQKYSNTPVITVDDDFIYTENMVEDLYKTHIQHPEKIIGGYCQFVGRDDNGVILPSRMYWTKGEAWQTRICSKVNFSDHDLFGGTGGGCLFPVQMCRMIDPRILKIIPYYGTDDESVLFTLAHMNGIDYMTPNTRNKCYFTSSRLGFFCEKIFPWGGDEYALHVQNMETHDWDKNIQFMEKYNSVDELVDAMETQYN